MPTNTPVLSSKERKSILDGLEEQGATIDPRAGEVYKVLSPDGTSAVINLGNANPRSILNVRTRMRKMGFYWPLDPDPTPRARAKSTSTGISDVEVARARERALAAESAIRSAAPVTRPVPVQSTAPHDHLLTLSDEPLEDWIDLTPRYAEQLLGKNTDNRSIRPGHVTELARDMAAGNWQVTGDSIKFDINDKLIDGQHRLLAVIKSGVTIRTLMIIGLQPEAREVIDTNAKRSAKDALVFDGQTKNASIVASVARIAMIREAGGYTHSLESAGNQTVTNTEVINWVRQHSEVHRAAGYGNLAKRSGFTPSAFAYFAMEVLAVNETAASEFLDSLVNYTTEGPGDPRFTLLKWIAAARSRRSTPGTAEMLFALHRTWNAWRADQRLSSMYSAGKNGDGSVIPKLVK